MGVFATRSPYRPNPLGLSSVRIEKIELDTKDGPVITVSGADIMNDTPIYDIKPYLAYVDSHTDASDGFALNTHESILDVRFPAEIAAELPQDTLDTLTEILAQDPRPQYQSCPERVYTMSYSDLDISFTVDGNMLQVTGIRKIR